MPAGSVLYMSGEGPAATGSAASKVFQSSQDES